MSMLSADLQRHTKVLTDRVTERVKNLGDMILTSCFGWPPPRLSKNRTVRPTITYPSQTPMMDPNRPPTVETGARSESL